MYILHQSLFYISTVILGYCIVVDPTLVLMCLLWTWIVDTTIVSAYYHRYLCHNSWNCPKFIEAVLLFLGAGHGMLPAIGFVNVHVRHHRFADTSKDPHGPARTLLENFNLALSPFEMRYVTRSITQNKLVRWQAKYHWFIMVVYFFIWSLFLDPLGWFVVLATHYLSLVAVNILGHWKKTIRNIPSLGVILAGESYHKNHHDKPTKPRFGKLDPGWWFISLVQRFQKN